MKTSARAMLLLLAIGFHGSRAAAEGGIGIAPVYDASGDAWGASYAQYLSLYTYQELSKEARAATLLNPGGIYTPADPTWLVDYARGFPKVVSLLAITLRPSLRPDHGKWTLVAEVSLLDSKTGDTMTHFTSTQEIGERDTDLASSYDDPWAGVKMGLTTGHRTFDKSPLGKAARRTATDIASHLARDASDPQRGSAASTAQDQSCTMHIRILYGYRHAASQAYSLLVNGLDESTYIQDGVATFKAAEGSLLVQFAVADPPYKMARQRLYQTSPYLACNQPTYVVDLGKSGEAYEHWE